MVLMGWLKGKFAASRTPSYLEQKITSLGVLLPYREPAVPRVLVTLRRISWRIALAALLTVFVTGFFLRDYARYELRAGDTPPDVAWLCFQRLGGLLCVELGSLCVSFQMSHQRRLPVESLIAVWAHIHAILHVSFLVLCTG